MHVFGRGRARGKVESGTARATRVLDEHDPRQGAVSPKRIDDGSVVGGRGEHELDRTVGPLRCDVIHHALEALARFSSDRPDDGAPAINHGRLRGLE